MIGRPRGSTLFPYTTLFGSGLGQREAGDDLATGDFRQPLGLLLMSARHDEALAADADIGAEHGAKGGGDRKSTRLNSSHANISYAVFCLKKKKWASTACSRS